MKSHPANAKFLQDTDLYRGSVKLGGGVVGSLVARRAIQLQEPCKPVKPFGRRGPTQIGSFWIGEPNRDVPVKQMAAR